MVFRVAGIAKVIADIFEIASGFYIVYRYAIPYDSNDIV